MNKEIEEAISEKYEKLEHTHDIKEVSFNDFVECWVKSETRGYNTHTPVIHDTYLALSSPLPNKGGVHYTLIYNCEDENPYKVLYEMHSEYLIYYEEWVRKDERFNVVEKIRDKEEGNE